MICNRQVLNAALFDSNIALVRKDSNCYALGFTFVPVVDLSAYTVPLP